MKPLLFKKVIFLSMFLVLFLLIGCTGLTSTETTVTTSTTSSDTVSSQTTLTTTTTTTTTQTTTTTTTTEVVEQLENLDALVLSLDRLETVEINVDFDSIFSENSQDISNLSFVPKRYLPGIGTEWILSSGNENETYDPEDYVHHTYWPEPMYHKNLYIEPTLEGGMYHIDTLLNSYNNTALNNLYQVSEGVFLQANDEVDWAVDHISVMNTWIQTNDMGKFMLDYDSINDIVNLYHVWYQEDWGLTSLNKISVYYNENGEEVIEKWTNEYYSKGDYPGAFGYFNTIGSRDFNYYCVWLNEELELSDQHHFRGINQTENGNYEYYDNDYSVISGDSGWYTILRFTDPVTGNLVGYKQMMDTYCPTGDSNVITWSESWDGYHAKVYLPAFSGLEEILVQEGGIVARNQDSPDTQAFLIGEGKELMPNQYVYNSNGTDWITGIKTAEGSFLSTDAYWNDVVKLSHVELSIASEGEKEYANYYKYLGTMELIVDADSLEEAGQVIAQYFAYVGLTYKYGDSAELFAEFNEVYENFDDIASQVQITNKIMNNPYMPYRSSDQHTQTLGFIYEYLNIREGFLQMLEDIDTINYADMPPMEDITSVNLLDASEYITGELSFTNNQIDSTGLDVTIPQSTLLRTQNEYTIYYAFAVGNKLFNIGSELAQTYSGTALQFTNGSLLDIPEDLPDGEYALMLYYAKNENPGTVRISNTVLAPFAPADPVQIEIEHPEMGFRTVFQLVFQDGYAFMNVFHEDIQPPFVTVEGHTGIYLGVMTVSGPIYLNGQITVGEFLNHVININDNFDGQIIVDYMNLSHNGNPLTSDSDLMESGTYVLTVEDSSGNISEITFDNVIVQFQVDFILPDSTILTQFVNMGEDALPPDVAVDYGYHLVGWVEDYTSVLNHLEVHAIISANLHTITYMVDDVIYQVVESVSFGSSIVLIDDPVSEGYVFSGWSSAPETMPDEDIVITGTFTPIG
ncbi:MAG: InlB B-repeat-containing protein [Firmicutes bacterium]|nr:InlB B-repeat-containing protein [Bacillota bacterium]